MFAVIFRVNPDLAFLVFAFVGAVSVIIAVAYLTDALLPDHAFVSTLVSRLARRRHKQDSRMPATTEQPKRQYTIRNLLVITAIIGCVAGISIALPVLFPL